MEEGDGHPVREQLRVERHDDDNEDEKEEDEDATATATRFGRRGVSFWDDVSNLLGEGRRKEEGRRKKTVPEPRWDFF